MRDLEQSQASISEARHERDEAENRLHQTNGRLSQTTEQLRALKRAGVSDEDPRIEELIAQQSQLATALSTQAAELDRLRATAHALQLKLLEDLPQRLVEQLDDRFPFLLFPIRIETKFMTANGKPELWVRIFPDVISNFTHQSALTADERKAGEDYWTKRWEARGKSEAEQETLHRGLWNVLATGFGPQRAAWVIHETRPTNWSDDLNSIGQLNFPAPQETMAEPWTRAPHARGMPDRFVVTTYRGRQKIHEVLGAHVPDNLKLGPDPLQIKEELKREESTGEIAVGEEIAWMFDFKKAERVGMAVRIELEPGDLRGFDRVVVLGLRLSSDARKSGQLLEELIDNHHYANEGLSLVPQGTPTNNTENEGSGFSTLDTANEKSFETETGGELFKETVDYFGKADGQRLAEALGIRASVFHHIRHSDGTDIKEALAMNTALWAATWGLFLERWMEPQFSEDDVSSTQEFFTEFVTGRGLLPAIRVGNQPYGVLVTSSFDKWRWATHETDGAPAYWDNLKAILARLQGQWQMFAERLVAHAGKSDDFQNLLSVVGLQASSVEYYSRKAVSDLNTWNYLNFGGFAPFMQRFWNELQLRKAAALAAIGLGAPANPFINKLTFLSQLDSLQDSPLIDADPKVPLSERDRIRPFNDTDNYIDWLLKSDWEAIKSQTFKDKTGQTISPPSALLFRMLYRSYTESFNRTIVRTLAGANAISVLPVARELENIGHQHLTLTDYQNVDASRIMSAGNVPLTTEKITLGAHLQRGLVLNVAPMPEAIPLLSVRKALETLSLCPTARLERLFAEHVDLCSYRLDAWQTGIFARRLHQLRHSGGPVVGLASNPSFRSGIYLGAFGWVEDLRPAASRKTVSLDTLPEKLRKPDKGRVVEDEANEGYIHAPSTTHAVAGAVLRNAYRSHHNEETMAVNLSSERVRTALTYLDGLRNNQELAALLGYQFERGLHDNHRLELQLDAVIYQFREAFPLISKVLTPVPGGTRAEVIEARNVVNGYNLLKRVRENQGRFPYHTLNPVPNAEQQKAIDAEIDRLASALDAIGDLALSESVFQVVQGNYDRAGGMMQAITEAKPPPEPEIVNTPRSGQTITLRVAVNFDVTQTTAWSAFVPLTPRAEACAQLNHWLSEVLPDPRLMEVAVKQQSLAQEFISFDQLELQPIDLVLMTGTRVGDNSSELERYIDHHFRKARSLGNEVVTYFYQKPDASVPDAEALVFNPRQTSGATKISLYELMPLLRSLRQIVSVGRALNAQDYMVPTEAQEYSKGYNEASDNLGELFTRVKTARDNLSLMTGSLKSLVETTLSPAYKTFEDDPQHVVDPAWEAMLNTARGHLLQAHRFGLAEALPSSATGFTRAEIERLVPQAQAVLKILEEQLKEATTLLQPLALPVVPVGATIEEKKKIEEERDEKLEEALANYTQAAKLLLGKSFNLLPLYRLHAENRAELQRAITGSDNLFDASQDKALVIEEWLQGIARIRTQMETFESAVTFNDLLTGNAFELTPIQLPHRPDAGWIGVHFKVQEKREDMLSIVMHQPPVDLTSLQCGLLIDEWTEVIPAENETTAIAFHYNRPNAMPPQSILLAVTPELKGNWTWNDLMDILNETLDRAKRRAVEPEMIDGSVQADGNLPQSNYFQVLPAILHDFTTYNLSSMFVLNSTKARANSG
ncbi:MAG TPA: hypothetical protein VJS44_18465 [Pyrinomonadaceae bacterium]|nr:hypothetical protein [Pyrinomonadaceae bacterium]